MQNDPGLLTAWFRSGMHSSLLLVAIFGSLCGLLLPFVLELTNSGAPYLSLTARNQRSRLRIISLKVFALRKDVMLASITS